MGQQYCFHVATGTCWSSLQQVKGIMQLDHTPARRTAQTTAQYTQAGEAAPPAPAARHSPRQGATLALLCGILGAVFLGSLLLGHYSSASGG
jgi:hypothetical protein